MSKVLVIIGPTAVGKTAFGIECARLFNGEIISGDSIQVYKGLDIGSAKASAEEQKAAVHHLIDIKEADENYSVKEFQELARAKIKEISQKGKLPIIVGGTGLYVKACLYDFVFFEENEEDDPFTELSNEELYAILLKEDPTSLEKIHPHNRKRLVRALNVLRKHDKGISAIRADQSHQLLYDAKIIGLDAERTVLYEKCDRRIDQMIKDGLIEEIKTLLDRGISFSAQSMQAIGYKEFAPYFAGEKDLETCIDQVKRNTRHFIKRQYTYFSNQLAVEWYKDPETALARVKDWYE